jgi:hypothetical protein
MNIPDMETITAIHKDMTKLARDRDDFLVGLTIVITDLYNVLFEEGADTRAKALKRLRAELRIRQRRTDRVGSKYLRSLISQLAKGSGPYDSLLYHVKPRGNA